MNEKLKIEAAHLAIAILITGAFFYYIGHQSGYLKGITEFETALDSSTAEISECDGEGCSLRIPLQNPLTEKRDDPFWVRCGSDYICTRQPKTEEIRKRDEELQKLYDLLPTPVTDWNNL